MFKYAKQTHFPTGAYCIRPGETGDLAGEFNSPLRLMFLNIDRINIILVELEMMFYSSYN